jgi:hypothetical protein
VRLGGVGLLTGWGLGVGTLPQNAVTAAAGRRVIAIPRPPLTGDRYRRATRECLLGIAAVEELLATSHVGRGELAGSGTALLYATASAYAASNRSFIEAARGTVYFPYTAPSAVPAEVAIEYQLSGSYAIFIGGAAATIDALWYAETLLNQRACERALVLAVETFEACADLYARGRWLLPGPLVEAAACALLLPGGRRHVYTSRSRPSGSYRGRLTARIRGTDAAPPDTSKDPDVDGGAGGVPEPQETIRHRAGETLACAPLIALAVEKTEEPTVLSGLWRGRLATVAAVEGSSELQ